MQWQPSATIQMMQTRSEITWKLREFFQQNGFWETQTPVLSRDTVVDRHLNPVHVDGSALELAAHNDIYYLQTSPEFAMKRLLAHGLKSIYQICSAFRAGERGALHNPEFTMVEWYRAGDSLRDGLQFLSDLVSHASRLDAPEIVTYRDVFQAQLDCDPITATVSELEELGQRLGVSVAEGWSDDRDDWLNLLFATFVQPALGIDRPLIVTHYPASQSALAQICPQDPQVAERFELFIDRIEIANGYAELTDAGELATRNRDVNRQRREDGNRPLPTDSRLLEAMHHGLPTSSGCALGLDRFLMAITGHASIDAVMPFPVERC